MFVIDPVDQVVLPVRPDPAAPFLDEVRRLIGVPQVQTLGLNDGTLCLFVDGMGMLKGPTQRFFTIRGGDTRFAGKALLAAVDRDTGRLAMIPPGLADALAADIVFVPHSITLDGLDERLLVQPGHVPMVMREPRFSDTQEGRARGPLWVEGWAAPAGPEAAPRPSRGAMEPAAATPTVGLDSVGDSGSVDSENFLQPELPLAAEPPFRWVVSRRSDDSFRAVRFALEGDALVPTAMLSAATLGDLRALLPGGLERLDPEDDAPPEVIEYLAPKRGPREAAGAPA